MPEKSINEAAKELAISKSSLRYYEKVKLIQPSRTEGGYRSYSDWDLLLIKYILVLKYGEFSLEDIQTVLSFIQNEGTEDCLSKTETLIQIKTQEFQQKVNYYQQMLAIFEGMPNLAKADSETEKELDHYVEHLFEDLKGNGGLNR
ncbi:MerR family transcriptional regulator [Vagococcus sp. BWB3-3]|uniref:MerR family transcriptional regulator n=1 Tax=Vagococcus allomyrinae TaxID=2794353 RepID=A0A940PDB9_9ENTE|nr:MerR family transcriptional regulator [Vagococcus allomyrinae]MBP1042849.1 MerR family transcriptional regulator [Vagococcus allomyrinae]